MHCPAPSQREARRPKIALIASYRGALRWSEDGPPLHKGGPFAADSLQKQPARMRRSASRGEAQGLMRAYGFLASILPQTDAGSIEPGLRIPRPEVFCAADGYLRNS